MRRNITSNMHEHVLTFASQAKIASILKQYKRYTATPMATPAHNSIIRSHLLPRLISFAHVNAIYRLLCRVTLCWVSEG